jgi:hypothetical protein
MRHDGSRRRYTKEGRGPTGIPLLLSVRSRSCVQRAGALGDGGHRGLALDDDV